MNQRHTEVAKSRATANSHQMRWLGLIRMSHGHLPLDVFFLPSDNKEVQGQTWNVLEKLYISSAQERQGIHQDGERDILITLLKLLTP